MTPVNCLEAGPTRHRTDESERDEERKTRSVGVTVFHISWLEGLPTNIITYSLITHLEVAKAAELPTTSFNKSDTSSSRGFKLLPDQV